MLQVGHAVLNSLNLNNMVPWYTESTWNDLERDEWKVAMGGQQLTGVATKSLREFLQLEATTPADLAAMSEDHLFMITILKSIEPKANNNMPISFNTRKK
jgi:hypothetical protein